MSEPALDQQQLERIEATHGGFAYQHLYAVACMLSMTATGTAVVVIEHDEDVELIRADVHIYAQVKTRSRPLRHSDIDTALQRFDALRGEHAEGRRAGAAQFAVISNTEPGPQLARSLGSAKWPSDVALLWPGHGPPSADLQIPPAWPNLSTALHACAEQAKLVPFKSLSPETLVLKLAALVMYIATGYRNHRATAAEVAEFFEQLVAQLQQFPEPPTHYRQQVDEPDLGAPDRVQLLVGVSGAGKTAWASHAASQHAGPTAYLDVGELPASALATSLARELAARFLADVAPAVGGAILPTGSGLEVLRAIAARVRDVGHDVLVVLDNVHRLPVTAVRELVEVAVGLRFVLLGQQPWTGQGELTTRLGIRARMLGGWGLDTVIATFALAGCPVDARVGERIRHLTAGVPLYVESMARVAAETHDGNANAFLDAIENRLNVDETAQEIILADTVDSLSGNARIAAALMDLSDVALGSAEVLTLVGGTGLSAQTIAAAVRELIKVGVVQRFSGGLLKLHDAYRLLARDIRTTMAPEVADTAREALVALVEQSLPVQWTVARFGLWLRLLAQTGRVNTLIDVATNEEFHQVGDPQELKSTLQSAARDTSLSVEERFWAADALAFWAQRDEDDAEFMNMVELMSQVCRMGSLAQGARIELTMKQMWAAALLGDRDALDKAYAAGADLAKEDPAVGRLVHYNQAASLFQLGEAEEASRAAYALVLEYYDHLRLEPEHVLGGRAEDIVAAVGSGDSVRDDLRHTADCLNLVAMANRKLGRASAMACLHAMKFFLAAAAWRSGVRAGQDAIDELIEIGEFDSARHVAETLLPAVAEYELLDILVPFRGQYAVVLAWCGEFEAARSEIGALDGYHLSQPGELELQNQRQLIEHIAAVRQTAIGTDLG